MIETGQNLTFVLEARNDECRILAAVDKLDCYPLLILMGALGGIGRAMALATIVLRG